MHIVDQQAHYANYLSENAHAVGALAEEDLDPWEAEKAWLWHQADWRGDIEWSFGQMDEKKNKGNDDETFG